MNRRRRRAAVVSLLLAAVLALASVVASAGSASASTRTEPLRASFENMMPGSTASAAWQLDLLRNAVVTEVTTVQTGPGDVDWTVELLDRTTGASTPVVDGDSGAHLAAGSYDLRVTVTVVDIPGGATNSLDGHIVFAEAGAAGGGEIGAPGGGSLASTGFAALPLLLAAVATALAGLFLLLAARRRRDEEDEARTVPVTVPNDPRP